MLYHSGTPTGASLQSLRSFRSAALYQPRIKRNGFGEGEPGLPYGLERLWSVRPKTSRQWRLRSLSARHTVRLHSPPLLPLT